MMWLWILAGILGYFIMWILTSILTSRAGFKDEAVLVGLMWPIMFPIITVIYLTDKYG